MSGHKRIGRNIGRIELLAVRDTVKTMLEAGYDRKKIHSRLMKEGGITMSYPTFCYQFKQQFQRNGALAAPPAPSQRPEPTGPAKADRPDDFPIKRNPTVKDFK